MARDESIRTQQQLEAKSGLSQSSVWRVLHAYGATTVDTIAKLAEAIGCQPWELLVDEEATRAEAIARMLRR